ncbi:MAG: hypothetical protein ACYC1M_15560 [Armatimonadota bacterium]
MKSFGKNMVICWGLLCLGLLWPVVIYMLLAHTVDGYHLSRAGAYVLAVIGLGAVVGRGIQRQQRGLILASLLPVIFALLMAIPFLVLFHPLMYFSPEMSELPGPGTLLLLVVCGAPVAMCALPYTVVLASWRKGLKTNDLQNVSAHNSTTEGPVNNRSNRKSQIILIVCWAFLCLSFICPVLLPSFILHNIGLADGRLLLARILYTVMVIVLGSVIGIGLFRQKRWAYYSSIVPTVISFALTVFDFVARLHILLSSDGLIGSKGENHPLLYLTVLILWVPDAIGTLLYLVCLILWTRKARQLARYVEVQAG